MRRRQSGATKDRNDHYKQTAAIGCEVSRATNSEKTDFHTFAVFIAQFSVHSDAATHSAHC